ncbi:hypothetical protein [Leptospira stimsonii]|uniref:Uncharacterized protein n=1 Tax=Leptospira stimsonii TaxID=2202203 RepID=A0ABY2N519_9LEPT|nr:hypothetical protein [Leptospira stimsonii]TGK26945.1 hypothetical protein EHO98_00010 [Leptospira stimsonii]TGM16907.1 hypothetical protein EHQ90_08375 [Leptospira stimsonii]
MYFLISSKGDSFQLIFSDFYDLSIFKNTKSLDEDLECMVEFSDMEELIEFYPNEIKKNPVCNL